MKTPEITVLPITRDLIPACTALYIRTFTLPPWCDEIPSPQPVIDYFENFLKMDTFLGYAAFFDGRLAALSTGMKKPWRKGIEYYIDEFCVDPDLQRQGIGSQFLKTIEADIAARGMCGMVLTTEAAYGSFDFFVKNGFEKLGSLCVLGK
ncbi:MAG: GNAT family N-acetyltransferase [Clostridia bacterium]|nr:GNAT family N-acetyltransferase [Clostridia bacterium]